MRFRKSLEVFSEKKVTETMENTKNSLAAKGYHDVFFGGLAMLRVLILIEKSQRNLQWVFDQ